MAITLASRKPVNQLKLDDLEAFPIWEYAIDEEGVRGQDETWVRPVGSTFVPKRLGCFFVAAQFWTNDDQDLFGAAEVYTNDGFEVTGAILLFGDKYIPISVGGLAEEQEHIARQLSSASAAVFPLRFRLKSLLHRELFLRGGALTP